MAHSLYMSQADFCEALGSCDLYAMIYSINHGTLAALPK